MLKNLLNIDGAKLLNKVAQENIKGGKPVPRMCALGGICPPGFCCKSGVCIDDTPGPDGTIPACDSY
ncbi:MAG: hypothetical protein HOO91_04005 [Bacteroidales bacterium]|nr:hypothetical protein [Bacteroidales bacterium]